MHHLKSWQEASSTQTWWLVQPVTFKLCSQEHPRSIQIWKRMICSSKWMEVSAMPSQVGPPPTSTWRLLTNPTNKDSTSFLTISCNQLSQLTSSQRQSRIFIINSKLLTSVTIGIILTSGFLCLIWDHQSINSHLEPATSLPCQRPKPQW